MERGNGFGRIFGLAAGIVALHWGLQNLSALLRWAGVALGLLTPFLLGLCIAFILNVPMKAIERRLFPAAPKRPAAPIRRLCSLLLTVAFVLAVLLLVVFIVYPELRDTVRLLRDRAPGFWVRVQGFAGGLAQENPAWGSWLDAQLKQINWDSVGKTLLRFLRNGATSVLNSTFSVATSVLGSIFNFALGLVFAVYILLQKETLARQCKKLLYAYLPDGAPDRVLYIGRLSNRIFSNFLTGQCLEAVILGMLFFISMSLLRMPYALMVSVLIAFTALIPVFGAFIGCIVGTFLILVSSPVQAFWFLVLFLVLQQLEGNLIYPRVVGSSVGLPGMWVLAAVTIGGSTLGVLGMLVMVPLASVLYALLREAVQKRLACRAVPAEKYE